jgi:hypothetical protein
VVAFRYRAGYCEASLVDVDVSSGVGATLEARTMRIGGVSRGSSGELGQVEEEVHEGPVRPVYRPGRTWMFTFLPDWAKSVGARRRGLVGGATKLRRDCGHADLVGVCECGWVCRGALRRAHACHYLDLKNEDSPLLVEEKSRAGQASYHRMHTDMGVCAWQAQTKGEELFIYFT